MTTISQTRDLLLSPYPSTTAAIADLIGCLRIAVAALTSDSANLRQDEIMRGGAANRLRIAIDKGDAYLAELQEAAGEVVRGEVVAIRKKSPAPMSNPSQAAG